MELFMDHPDYHGSGPIDDAYVFLSDREKQGHEAPLPLNRYVHMMTEGELIELSTTLPSAVSPLGKLAFDEYMKRRGKVINRAIEQRRAHDES